MFCKISVKAEHKGRGEVVLSTITKNPGILLACRTSREVALSQLSECLDLGTKQTRFDPANDTICLYQYETSSHHLSLLPYRFPLDTYGQYIHKFAGVHRFIMECFPGFLGHIEGILFQLPNLKTLVVVSNTRSELHSLDMNSLRLCCASDATAMEISSLDGWFQFRRAFEATLSRVNTMLDRYNKTRGVGNHAEMTLMKLYNC